jgi:4-hydroxy-tetrahydrodipicolinate synthase
VTERSAATGQIRGIFPIVYTPFDATGAIDWDDLHRLVEYLSESGTHGLSAVGGASECHKMPVAERRLLAEATMSAARGRVPVLVGTSATNTADAVELSGHAESIGAIGTFSTPPLYGAVTAASLTAHYGALARSTSLPILIQDAMVSLPLAVVGGLGEQYPQLRWMKEEALDSGHRITELRRICTAGITIMSGGSYLLDDLARGAVGAIPGSIGVSDLALAYDLWVEGDHPGARRAFNHFAPLALWRRQFPLLGTKEVLRRLGVLKGAYLREPADERLDDDDHRELSEILEAMSTTG